MNYRDGDFCDTLEAIRKRLSDLRAVLNSECCNQIEPKYYHYTHHENHHSISKQGNFPRHKKSHKHKKSQHHYYCVHHSRLKNEERSIHKKRNTDKIGRPLYARAIPIEKYYLLSNVEIARLIKNNPKDKNEITINNVSKKRKSPILFPYEEINLKNEKLMPSDEYNSSDYYYSDSESDDVIDISDDPKQILKKHSNKKQIVYLKTYQTNKKKKERNGEPQIIQEKGKIIYFDTSDDETDSNEEFVNIESKHVDLNYVPKIKAEKYQSKKKVKKSHNVDPIVPITTESDINISVNQISKVKKPILKEDSINKQPKSNPSSKKSNEFKYVIKHKKKIIKTNQLNDGQPILKEIKNTNINTTVKEYRKTSKKKPNQINIYSPATDYNLYKLNNYFTFKMCIESQPICIAIGDIEGDIEKLYPICNLIKANPSLNFLFIGDLIDDISDACPLAEKNWECLYLLSEFFTGKDKNLFRSDNDTNFKANNKYPLVNLPSAFNEIHFEKADFDKIQSRVKFVAGNSECDVLSDIIEGCDIIYDDEMKYVFGKNKWKKTVNFERLCLLYRYFKSCYGIIKLEKKNANIKEKKGIFTDTVYFRHAPSTFKRSPDIIAQMPDLDEIVADQRNFIFITGHIRKFVSGSSKNPEAQAFIIDTSPKNYNTEKEINQENCQSMDKRLAVVSYDDDVGFTVKAFSLPGEFPLN